MSEAQKLFDELLGLANEILTLRARAVKFEYSVQDNIKEAHFHLQEAARGVAFVVAKEQRDGGS